MEFMNYMIANKTQVTSLLLEHIELTFIAVSIAICIGVPLGIGVSYVHSLRKPILGFANLMQAVPSMALLGFMIPFLGIGSKPAIAAVIIYSLLPIIKNTFAGIQNVNPDTLESAEGIGMTKTQILLKVQIPSALPIIMAGIRISAVTAVGLMTIASFIGAGGLGYLVFSGIRTVNNAQILAGAIPACLLALCMDFVLGFVEKVVTPISLRTDINLSNANTGQITRKTRAQQKALIATFSAIALFFISTNVVSAFQKENTFVISGKADTEQEILCHMMAELLEYHTDIPIERRPTLGGTQTTFGALDAGEIDLYIDYTGTLYGNVLSYPALSDAEEVYQVVRRDMAEKYQIKVMESFDLNNTYALAVRPDTAKEYNLQTISDLEKISSNLILSATLEFLDGDDTFKGLEKAYPNLAFKEIFAINDSPRYIALTNYESDVIDAYATDGLLEAFELVVLEDDKEFFLPYYAVPIMKEETLLKYPEVESLLTTLGTVINDDVMRALNAKVSVDHEDARDVAHEFLIQQNLIE